MGSSELSETAILRVRLILHLLLKNSQRSTMHKDLSCIRSGSNTKNYAKCIQPTSQALSALQMA